MNKNLVGFIVSAVTAVVAPIIGVAAMFLLLGGSIRASENADPADKGRVLGEAISNSMMGVGCSVLVVVFALVAAVVFGVRFYRDVRRDRTAA